jgi:hypothetical protein
MTLNIYVDEARAANGQFYQALSDSGGQTHTTASGFTLPSAGSPLDQAFGTVTDWARNAVTAAAATGTSQAGTTHDDNTTIIDRIVNTDQAGSEAITGVAGTYTTSELGA